MIVPSLAVIVLIHNVYLLGQPNLMLLALLLGAFACLRLGRQSRPVAWWPRRRRSRRFRCWSWATWSTGGCGPPRWRPWPCSPHGLDRPVAVPTPAQAVDDLVRLVTRMVFTYNTYGIAQRPFRSYSYKNQSIMGWRTDCFATCRPMASRYYRKTRAGQPGGHGWRMGCLPWIPRPTCSLS